MSCLTLSRDHKQPPSSKPFPTDTLSLPLFPPPHLRNYLRTPSHHTTTTTITTTMQMVPLLAAAVGQMMLLMVAQRGESFDALLFCFATATLPP